MPLSILGCMDGFTGISESMMTVTSQIAQIHFHFILIQSSLRQMLFIPVLVYDFCLNQEMWSKYD